MFPQLQNDIESFSLCVGARLAYFTIALGKYLR